MNPELYDKLVRLYCIEKAIIDDETVKTNSNIMLNLEMQCDELIEEIDNYGEITAAKFKLRKEFKLN